jgi:hypothetical protein
MQILLSRAWKLSITVQKALALTVSQMIWLQASTFAWTDGEHPRSYHQTARKAAAKPSRMFSPHILV